MTRNLRAIVRALKRVRRRVPWCDRKIKGTYREVVFASGTATANGGFTSTIYDTDYPGAFTELTFGSRRL